MNPEIIFEDTDIIVLYKPAGLIVNNADTTQGVSTLQDWVEEQFKIQNLKFKIDEESDFIKRAGIVHRLDKETSGIIIVAKNEESFKNLQAQFKAGEVEKTYLALVHGSVMPPEGEIKLPIGRLPWNRTRFGVFPQGRQSHTQYKVIGYKKDSTGKAFSLIEVHPKTGRTHQIRVHFQYQGFPLVSDELYAGRKQANEDRAILSRHFLHATEIQFSHPGTQKRLSFTSPLPKDLQLFLSTLS